MLVTSQITTSDSIDQLVALLPLGLGVDEVWTGSGRSWAALAKSQGSLIDRLAFCWLKLTSSVLWLALSAWLSVINLAKLN